MLLTYSQYSFGQENQNIHQSETEKTHSLKKHSAKPFNDLKIDWLSSQQIEQHKELYHKYVTKRNEIEERLKTTDRSKAESTTYSEYRELKIEETYAVNGHILHELYFENIGNKPSKIGPEMEKLINAQFGSVDAFKKDFIAAASSARGWVVTTFGLDDGTLHTYILEQHNQNVPILTIPLLVFDVYEHAYMIDFGIKRKPYIEHFWDTIRWDIVEKRIERWVQPFIKK